MTRDEAIDLLARRMMSSMSATQKLDMAGGWWTVEPEDSVWSQLSERTQQLVASKDYPDLQDVGVVEDLVLIGVSGELGAYANDWLARRASEATGQTIQVDGAQPHFLPCPCCRFRTLATRGEYSICPVCFWEDDGSDDPGRYSSPNGTSIVDYRRKAQVIEAVKQEMADPRFRAGSLPTTSTKS